VTFFEQIGVGVVGFFIGNLLFARVVTVAAAISSVVKDGSLPEGSKVGQITMMVLFSDGLWISGVAGALAYYLHDAAWFDTVAWGALIAITFYSFIAIWMAWQYWHRKRTNNAA
jgi:hypothetical protein